MLGPHEDQRCSCGDDHEVRVSCRAGARSWALSSSFHSGRLLPSRDLRGTDHVSVDLAVAVGQGRSVGGSLRSAVAIYGAIVCGCQAGGSPVSMINRPLTLVATCTSRAVPVTLRRLRQPIVAGLGGNVQSTIAISGCCGAAFAGRSLCERLTIVSITRCSAVPDWCVVRCGRQHLTNSRIRSADSRHCEPRRPSVVWSPPCFAISLISFTGPELAGAAVRQRTILPIVTPRSFPLQCDQRLLQPGPRQTTRTLLVIIGQLGEYL